jgi:hypothetical protein
MNVNQERLPPLPEQKPPSKKSTSRVDWSKPHLEALLKKTEGWQLDNRGSFTPQDIEIQLGWPGGMTHTTDDSARSALLVWEQDKVMVVETGFPIEQGELLRIDRMTAEGVQTVWGTLIESRPGQRAGDGENHIHLHWVHTR